MKDVTIYDHIEELDSESKYLVHKAKEATQHAYAPYSKFQVGAAVLLEDGTVITGANQENASYPLCMCAERVALYAAVSQHPDQKIMKVAVVAHKKNHKELSHATCCGACRQVMLELALKFEYLNTASSKLMVDIFSALAPIKGSKIIWYFHDDDEDMEEVGEELSELASIPFEFKTY